MSIKHNKQFLSLINDLTPISESVIINKTDDQVRISRANSASTVFYTLEAAKDAFDFDGEKIAFYNFVEFYQLLNVFENAEISLNENKLTISSDKSKIRYIISDPETIKAGPSQILFPSSDAKVVLESNEIKNLKKMIGLIKAKFIKSAKLGDILDIKTKCVELKNASALLHQEIWRENELLFSADINIAHLSHNKPSKMNEKTAKEGWGQ